MGLRALLLPGMSVSGCCGALVHAFLGFWSGSGDRVWDGGAFLSIRSSVNRYNKL